jgi:hypothetical protein
VLHPAAAALAEPAALLPSEASGKGLAVDAYFMDLARTSQMTGSLANGDTAPWHTFDLAPPAVRGTTDTVVPPPVGVTGTPIAAQFRRAAHAPAGDWGTDVLTLSDPPWDGEAAIRPAG